MDFFRFGSVLGSYVSSPKLVPLPITSCAGSNGVGRFQKGFRWIRPFTSIFPPPLFIINHYVGLLLRYLCRRIVSDTCFPLFPPSPDEEQAFWFLLSEDPVFKEAVHPQVIFFSTDSNFGDLSPISSSRIAPLSRSRTPCPSELDYREPDRSPAWVSLFEVVFCCSVLFIDSKMLFFPHPSWFPPPILMGEPLLLFLRTWRFYPRPPLKFSPPKFEVYSRSSSVVF